MDLFELVGKFVFNSSEANEQIDGVTNKAKSSHNSILSSIGNVAKGAMGLIGKVSGIGATIMASTGVVYNTQMEELGASFETMLGSADEANKHMDMLKKMGAATPLIWAA